MFELLFLVALISWLGITILQFLAGLPAFPTIAAAAVLAPPLACWIFQSLRRRFELEWTAHRRRPLPPEAFYWQSRRPALLRLCLAGLLALPVVWTAALLWPVTWAEPWRHPWGWLAAPAAVFCTALTAASGWLYVSASQRHNRLAPCLVGLLRRGLYRLSDNHEFLGEEPLPAERKKRDAVY